MIVHIAKGVHAYDTQILKVFLSKDDALEWIDNYDGDEDFAYLCVDSREVVEGSNCDAE